MPFAGIVPAMGRRKQYLKLLAKRDKLQKKRQFLSEQFEKLNAVKHLLTPDECIKQSVDLQHARIKTDQALEDVQHLLDLT